MTDPIVPAPVPAEPASKSPFLSKTILFNSFIALLGVLASFGVPMVGEFAKNHSDIILTSIGAIGIVLRFLTKGAIDIS